MARRKNEMGTGAKVALGVFAWIAGGVVITGLTIGAVIWSAKEAAARAPKREPFGPKGGTTGEAEATGTVAIDGGGRVDWGVIKLAEGAGFQGQLLVIQPDEVPEPHPGTQGPELAPVVADTEARAVELAALAEV